jgi:hypothetical protein
MAELESVVFEGLLAGLQEANPNCHPHELLMNKCPEYLNNFTIPA